MLRAGGVEVFAGTAGIGSAAITFLVDVKSEFGIGLQPLQRTAQVYAISRGSHRQHSRGRVALGSVQLQRSAATRWRTPGRSRGGGR